MLDAILLLLQGLLVAKTRCSVDLDGEARLMLAVELRARVIEGFRSSSFSRSSRCCAGRALKIFLSARARKYELRNPSF